jgi:hypothetical protein
MYRLSLILAVAAACGGASKPPPTSPLPDDTKTAQPAPAPAPAPPAKPAEPPRPPPGPVEVKIPAVQTTVKLVSGGKGKKEPLRYTLKPGVKQPIELVMDFSGKRDAEEQIVPTIVLAADAETTEVDKDGTADYAVTVTGTDAREVTGSQIPVDRFKQVISGLAGLKITGKLSPTGIGGEVTLRVESPPPHGGDAIELVRVTLPRIPALPTEPIGVGAKWQSTTTAKLADRLDVTQVTDYELVSHKGATWAIKGTIKITGKDQDIEASKVSDILGTGTSEATITNGAMYPLYKTQIETQFKAAEKTQNVAFSIKIGGAVTPKDAAAASPAKPTK